MISVSFVSQEENKVAALARCDFEWVPLLANWGTQARERLKRLYALIRFANLAREGISRLARSDDGSALDPQAFEKACAKLLR